MKNREIGYLYSLSVPIAAGLGTIEGIKIGGFSYTGWMWVFFLLSGFFLIIIRKALIKNSMITFSANIWFFWLGYTWLSLLWVDILKIRNLQDAWQMASPIIVGIVASLFIRKEEQLRSLRHAFSYCLLILIGVFVGFKWGSLEALGVSYFTRAMALTATLIGCVFIAGLNYDFRRSVLGWTGCLGITVFTGSRMTTFTLLLLLAVYPFYRRFLFRLLTIVILMGIGLGIFYTPIFQERFFGTETGSLKKVFGGEFISMGRFESWPIIWKEAEHHIMFGVGIGEAYSFVPKIWPGEHHEVNHMHNDYLRIIYEQGFVGLFCFLAVIFLQMNELRKKIKIRIPDAEERRAFVASFLGLCAFLVVSFTDNTIVYNLWYMNPLFAIMGAAYGVASRRSESLVKEVINTSLPRKIQNIYSASNSPI